jgi:hypothetical protein
MDVLFLQVSRFCSGIYFHSVDYFKPTGCGGTSFRNTVGSIMIGYGDAFEFKFYSMFDHLRRSPGSV